MNKVCKKCNIDKNKTEFYKYSKYTDGICKDCRNSYNNEWRRRKNTDNETYIRENLLKSNQNICVSCKSIKPLEAFRKSIHVKTGYLNTCKACLKVREKNIKLKLAYNINLDEFNLLLKKQNNTCAICKTDFQIKDICVDHCHKTGKVRGLLCHPCNRSIGMLKERKDVLYSAIRYLKLAQNKLGEFRETPEVDNPELSTNLND